MSHHVTRGRRGLVPAMAPEGLRAHGQNSAPSVIGAVLRILINDVPLFDGAILADGYRPRQGNSPHAMEEPRP